MKKFSLDVSDETKSDEQQANNIIDGHFGDIIVSYYTSKGDLQRGYVCDYKWSTTDADVFCSTKW